MTVRKLVQKRLTKLTCHFDSDASSVKDLHHCLITVESLKIRNKYGIIIIVNVDKIDSLGNLFHQTDMFDEFEIDTLPKVYYTFIHKRGSAFF